MSHSLFALLSSSLVLLILVYSTHGRRDNISPVRLKSSNETLLNFNTSSSGAHHIVFPGEYDPVVYQRFPEKLVGKKDCIQNICEGVDDYPEDYILNSLRRSGKYDDYFKEAILPIDIADRNNFDDEETLCQTRKHTTFPKTAINVNKTERIIVNVDGYQQALVFETCMENSKCKFSEMFPDDYEVSCKQRYTIRRLMALNDDQNPAFDSFQVPSCCVCTYKKKTRK